MNWPKFEELPSIGSPSILGNGKCMHALVAKEDYEAARRALLAIEIMERRCWHVKPNRFDGQTEEKLEWIVCSRPANGEAPNVLYRLGGPLMAYDGPVSALIEVDAWLTAREKEGGA